MKKNIVILLFAFISCTLTAQIVIDKTSFEGSSILDFKTGTTNGIILPAVSTIPVSPANGSFALYKADGRVYMYQNNAWVPLTLPNLVGVKPDVEGLSTLIINPSAELSGGAVIGDSSSPANGVLVLESENLALTLPKINNPAVNVKSPYPGMMCYDTSTNSLAVYDGKYWNYWK